MCSLPGPVAVLRAITIQRMARSAALLVASKPKQCRKVDSRSCSSRHPRQRPVQPAAADLQPKAIGQDLPRVSQRQPHLLVQDGRQGQRLRPQPHVADSHRIRSLQPMASLHPPAGNCGSGPQRYRNGALRSAGNLPSFPTHPRSTQISFRNKLDAFRLPVCGGPANWSRPTPPYLLPRLLSSKIFRTADFRSLSGW